MRTFRSVLAVSIFVCALGPTVGLAQEGQGLINMGETDMSDESARAHFKVGTSLYETGRFAEAGAEWEKAYVLSKRSKLLYNVYVAYRDASDQPRAIDALRRYLATGDVTGTQRLNLEARLRAMEKSQADAQATATASPTPSPVEAGPASTPEPAPESAAPAPTAASSDDGGTNLVLPMVLVGVGGAMVVGGVVTGLITNGKVADIEDACPNDLCPASFDLDGARDSASTLATVTDVLLIGGGVVLGTGVVLWLLAGDDESTEQPSAWTPALGCSSSGCAATVHGRF
jgi:hypothetical protein